MARAGLSDPEQTRRFVREAVLPPLKSIGFEFASSALDLVVRDCPVAAGRTAPDALSVLLATQSIWWDDETPCLAPLRELLGGKAPRRSFRVEAVRERGRAVSLFFRMSPNEPSFNVDVVNRDQSAFTQAATREDDVVAWCGFGAAIGETLRAKSVELEALSSSPVVIWRGP